MAEKAKEKVRIYERRTYKPQTEQEKDFERRVRTLKRNVPYLRTFVQKRRHSISETCTLRIERRKSQFREK